MDTVLFVNKNKNKMKKQIIKLATILGMGAVTGSIALASLTGFFKIQNVFTIAIAFISGPGAIITSSLLNGEVKERFLTALIAGIIATILVICAAITGPRLLELVNINLIKIFGGISIILIALLIMGMKIPENSPLWIIAVGLIAGIIWR